MEGSVIPWYQMMQKAKLIPDWTALTKAIKLQFGPSQFDCPRAKLFKLVQTDSLADYYKDFPDLVNRVKGVAEDALLDCFISGLKPDLKREIIAQSPSSLLRAVSLARLFDDKGTVPLSVPRFKPSYSSPLSSVPKSGTNNFPPPTNSTKGTLPPLLPTPPSKPLPPIKKMSTAEMQLRRDKGLCYTCDDKFTWNHKCPNKQYFILQMDDEDDDHSSIPIPEATDSSFTPSHHISFNALKGLDTVGTICFRGVIKGVEVQVLLDGGSSDNFIQPRLAHFLNLPVKPSPNFKVLVGNDNMLIGEGQVKNVDLIIQSYHLSFPVVLLPITGSDVVLGAAWLSTIGPHIADYSTASIKCYLHGKFISLQGERFP